MYELQGMYVCTRFMHYAILSSPDRRSSHQCTGYAKFVPRMHDLDDATVH